MRITSGVDQKESCVKVTEYVSPQERIIRKILLKLRNAYPTEEDHKESCVKVTECV